MAQQQQQQQHHHRHNTNSSIPYSSLTLRLLLSPLEYLVTINHSSLWQKHVAWAKPDGAHLKQYITGQYSSNMVLLSLLLTACINVFFNSSQELADLRKSLLGSGDQHGAAGGGGESSSSSSSIFDSDADADSSLFFFFFSAASSSALPLPSASTISAMIPPLKFWIGLILLLDIFVTLMGLIATFTLWCMISAISDANAHCVLRSSLGQYAMSLPPRLVVASLYIFLLWSGMFVLELVHIGPLSWILVIGILSLFLGAIVIPLSALGRLILQTGAMAQTPILPQRLEQQLLPSGLQASLLLRALHRQRRPNHPNNFSPGGDEDIVARQYRQRQRSRQQQEQQHQQDHQGDDDDEEGRGPTMIRPSEPSEVLLVSSPRTRRDSDGTPAAPAARQASSSSPTRHWPHGQQQKHQHRRFESVDTMASAGDFEFALPRASILNSAISKQQLYELVQSSFGPAPAPAPAAAAAAAATTPIDPSISTSRKEDTTSSTSKTPPASDHHDHPHELSSRDNQTFQLVVPRPTTAAANTSPNSATLTATAIPATPPVRRPPFALTRHHRRASSTASALVHEWTQDVSVRSLYGASMPAELPPEEIDIYETTTTTTGGFGVGVGVGGSTSLDHEEDDDDDDAFDPEDPSRRMLLHPSSSTSSRRWSLSPSVWWHNNNNPTAVAAESHEEEEEDDDDEDEEEARTNEDDSPLNANPRSASSWRNRWAKGLGSDHDIGGEAPSPPDPSSSRTRGAAATTRKQYDDDSLLDQLRQPLLSNTTSTGTAGSIANSPDRRSSPRKQGAAAATSRLKSPPPSQKHGIDNNDSNTMARWKNDDDDLLASVCSSSSSSSSIVMMSRRASSSRDDDGGGGGDDQNSDCATTTSTADSKSLLEGERLATQDDD